MIVAIVTTGGVADARSATVLSRHHTITAARLAADRARVIGWPDAAPEWVADFVAAGGSMARPRRGNCDTCGGNGIHPLGGIECGTCGGSGVSL